MNEPFYKKSKSYLICGLAGIIGALYIGASVFLNSITTVIDIDEKMTDGMTIMDTVKYSLSSMKQGFAIRKTFPIILLILLFVAVILMIAFAVKDNFLNKNYLELQKAENEKSGKPVKEFTKKPSSRFSTNPIYIFVTKHRHISRMIPIFVSALSLFGLYHTQSYTSVYKNTTDLVESWKSIITQYHAAGIETAMTAEVRMGLAKILIIVGFILFIGAFCFNFILDTLNED